ncbi:MAG: hypothetical protein IPN86_12120 [Saprospiraceae bacterium]|nr:hypothetical protein [Saprospiraceae bacterium]
MEDISVKIGKKIGTPDPDMNVTYHRDFKIVPIGKAYQIDDVVEFE